MKRTMPWGALKAVLSSIKPGESIALPHPNRGAIYSSAKYCGLRVRLRQMGPMNSKGRNGYLITVLN